MRGQGEGCKLLLPSCSDDLTTLTVHMFSLLNKEGELGFRFSKDVQEKYIQEFSTKVLKSHIETMKGYVLIPEEMLEDL